MTNPKVPKKGAVARLRKLYNERREKPLTPAQLEEMKDVFGKKNSTEKPTKKIARGDRDLESP